MWPLGEVRPRRPVVAGMPASEEEMASGRGAVAGDVRFFGYVHGSVAPCYRTRCENRTMLPRETSLR